jgi:ribose-phosphate pyrophosphokinase
MSTSRQRLKIFTANANPKLAEEIAEYLGVTLGASQVKRFSDGEIRVMINESVRGADVYIIQPTCNPVNDNLMELLIMVDAMRRASARRITAVIPYYGYARQERKARSRDPISAKLVANLLTAAGARRVLAMDLHANAIQGFFDIPVDHLRVVPIIAEYYLKRNFENVVVVSPDLGCV